MSRISIPRLPALMLAGTLAVPVGCQNNPASDDGDETEIGTGTETGDDRRYYQIGLRYDIGNEPDYRAYGDQGALRAYSNSTCINDSFRFNEEEFPYFNISVYFHDGYALLGIHDLRSENQEHPDYRQGFGAFYSPNGGWDPDQFLWVESGTVQVSDEGDSKYKIKYDLLFETGIHEVGEMIVEPCEPPFYEDG